jgi:hypothetical protein
MHSFLLVFFFLAGLLSTFAAILNLEWFFSSNNAFFQKSRIGARIFYGCLGVILLALAVNMYLQQPLI